MEFTNDFNSNLAYGIDLLNFENLTPKTNYALILKGLSH